MIHGWVEDLYADRTNICFYHVDLTEPVPELPYLRYLLICAPNENSYQPAYSHSLIGVFVVRIMKLYILCCTKCAQWIFWSDCANAQADLNLCWSHMSEGTFSNVTVHRISRIHCRKILASKKWLNITTMFRIALGIYLFHINSTIKFKIESFFGIRHIE